MKTRENRCSAGVGSMTQALKAQRALAGEAIPANVIKMPSSSLGKGCTYGIGFGCEQSGNVRTILERSRIAVKQWNTEN